MSEARDTAAVIQEAARTGRAVRLHIVDGEVLVARIMDPGPAEVVYAVVTSSRPEKYAFCDATGFAVPLDAVQKASFVS